MVNEPEMRDGQNINKSLKELLMAEITFFIYWLRCKLTKEWID